MNNPTVTRGSDLSLSTFSVVGLSIRTRNREAASTIPKLWQQALALDLPHTLHGACPFAVSLRKTSLAGAPSSSVSTRQTPPWIGLYLDYEGDHHDDFTLVVGVPFVGDLPIGELERFEVPALSYAHFEAHGPRVASITHAWQQIWADASLARAFAHDIEVYDAGAGDDGVVDLLISLSRA